MAIIDGVSVSGTVYGLRDNDTSGGIAPTFSTSTAYTAGQYVWYDSGSGAKLYRFTANHAAGAWTGTDATEVKLGNDVSALKSAFDKFANTQLTETVVDVTWAKGTLNPSNGGNATSNATLRSGQLAPCNAVSADNGYKYGIYVFDDNNSHAYVGVYNGVTTAPSENRIWLSGTTILPDYPDGYVVRILLTRETASSEITTAESAHFHAYNATITAVAGETSKIMDELAVDTQIDFAELSKVSAYIPSTNKWASGSGYRCYLVPVPSGAESVKIESDETYATVYALLTDNSHVTGATPAFYGDTKRVVMTAGDSVEITLAPEVTYMYFYATNGSNDYTPQSVVFSGFNKIAQINEAISDIYDILSKEINVDFSEYVETKGVFISVTNVWDNNSNYNCYIIPVPAHAHHVRIVSNAENPSIYALLSDASRKGGERPSFYNGSARVVMTNVPETTIALESGVKYMYFYSSGNGADYLPAGVIFSVYSGGDDLAKELRRLRAIVENSQPTLANGETEDVPETRGVRQALRKIKQLTTIQWTPLDSVPNNVSNFPAGTPVTGIVYSSVKELSKFVGLEVSLRTFMTAVHNPFSLLYTENVNATRTRSDYGVTYYGDNANAYYGMVCSTLVFYGLGIDVNWKTAQFQYLAQIGVLEKIYDQSADGLKLCDVQWIPGHTRIVTGIRRNEYGDVTEVQISEAFNLNMRVKWWTAEEVNGWTNDIWYRYTELYKNLDYTPSPFVTVPGDPELPAYQYNDDICTFAGDYAAFAVGDMVYLTYTKGAYTSLEIYKDNALIETIALSSIPEHKTDITSLMATNGYGNYKARLTDGTNASGYCYWQMIDCNVSVTNNNGVLTVDFSSHNGKPHYCSIIDRSGVDLATYVFSDAEKALGQAVFDAKKTRYEQYTTETFAETAYIIVLFKGEYGTVRNGWLDTGLYSE